MEKFQKETDNCTQIQVGIHFLKSIIAGSVLSACTNVPIIQTIPIEEIPVSTVNAPIEGIQNKQITPKTTSKDIKKGNPNQTNIRGIQHGPLGDKICTYTYNITRLCEYKPPKILRYQKTLPQEEIGGKIIPKVVLDCIESTQYNQKTGAARSTQKSCTPMKK